MTPVQVARIQSVVETFQFLHGWLANEDDAKWAGEVAEAIGNYDFEDAGFTCPLCKEVLCDDGCPLEVLRKHPLRATGSDVGHGLDWRRDAMKLRKPCEHNRYEAHEECPWDGPHVHCPGGEFLEELVVDRIAVVICHRQHLSPEVPCQPHRASAIAVLDTL